MFQGLLVVWLHVHNKKFLHLGLTKGIVRSTTIHPHFGELLLDIIIIIITIIIIIIIISQNSPVSWWAQ